MYHVVSNSYLSTKTQNYTKYSAKIQPTAKLLAMYLLQWQVRRIAKNSLSRGNFRIHWDMLDSNFDLAFSLCIPKNDYDMV